MHKCDTCEKLHSSVPLINDLLNMHAGDKTFNCDLCGKQEGAELCQAQPAKHKVFGSNGAIFLV